MCVGGPESLWVPFGWLVGFEVTFGVRNGLLSRLAWTKDISNFISGEGIHLLKKNPGLKEGSALVLVWPWLCACLLNLTLQWPYNDPELTHFFVPLSFLVEQSQSMEAYIWVTLSQTPSAMATTELEEEVLIYKGLFSPCTLSPSLGTLGWVIWGFQDPLPKSDYTG